MSPNPETPYPARNNGYVERWVYERDRQEDQREREVARREMREDAKEIKETLASIDRRIGSLEDAGSKRGGMVSVAQTALVVIPILIAIVTAILAITASS